MLTPLEIQNKNFDKGFRGYTQDQVDEFLDKIVLDYEKLYRENMELTQMAEKTADDLAKYNAIENTLKETLVIAKTTGEEIIKNSRDKAEIIIADAELRTINEHKKAERDLAKIKTEINRLKMDFKATKNKYSSFLESQIKFIDEFNIDNVELTVDDKNELK